MLHIIIHPQKSKLIILPIKDNSREPNFYGTLILKHTPKGARVGKFRIKQGEKEDFRAPEELIELLRLADKILIAEGNEASEAGFKELLTAYQLDYGYTTTCRLCLLAGKCRTNSPIRFHNESVCEDCAKKELIKEARSNKIGILLFLFPLVALANQKYEQFTNRYSSIATTSLRVGTSRIAKNMKGIRTTLASDIIVGTYE